MQSYIINSFRKISDSSTWIRQETGTNSGGYVYDNQVKRLNDFLCNGEFMIYSVLRVTGTGRNGILQGELFTIGDRLGVAYGDSIMSIKIIMSEVILNLTGGTIASATVKLQNAIKYKEPVATIKKPVAVKATKTTTKVNSGENKAFTTIVSEIESKIQPIRLEKTLKKRKETLEQFLVLFFKEWNNEKNTIFVDTLEVQTEMEKRRSIGDIYMICKYYYPNCTLNEVLNLLYFRLPLVITNGFRTSYCNTIKKKVWYYEEDNDTEALNKTANDEFGKPYKFYVDNITK